MAAPQLEKIPQIGPRSGSNPSPPPGLSTTGDDGYIPPDMSERIAKLEGAMDGLKMSVEGLRHSQNMATGSLGAGVGVGFLVVIFFLGYLLTRIDNLPAEFERLNVTLSNAITATKQQQPQVIFMPAPTTASPSNQK